MSLYDPVSQQTVGNGVNPWYAPQTQTNYPNAVAKPTYAQNTQPQNSAVSQFVWVNGPGVVDMWPVAARSEMTFIDNEAMMLYVKRVDEYNHPLKTRRFKLVEVLDEPEKKAEAPSINYEELKNFISEEVGKAVSIKTNNMFSFNNGSQTKAEGEH